MEQWHDEEKSFQHQPHCTPVVWWSQRKATLTEETMSTGCNSGLSCQWSTITECLHKSVSAEQYDRANRSDGVPRTGPIQATHRQHQAKGSVGSYRFPFFSQRPGCRLRGGKLLAHRSAAVPIALIVVALMDVGRAAAANTTAETMTTKIATTTLAGATISSTTSVSSTSTSAVSSARPTTSPLAPTTSSTAAETTTPQPSTSSSTHPITTVTTATSAAQGSSSSSSAAPTSSSSSSPAPTSTSSSSSTSPAPTSSSSAAPTSTTSTSSTSAGQTSTSSTSTTPAPSTSSSTSSSAAPSTSSSSTTSSSSEPSTSTSARPSTASKTTETSLAPQTTSMPQSASTPPASSSSPSAPQDASTSSSVQPSTASASLRRTSPSSSHAHATTAAMPTTMPTYSTTTSPPASVLASVPSSTQPPLPSQTQTPLTTTAAITSPLTTENPTTSPGETSDPPSVLEASVTVGGLTEETFGSPQQRIFVEALAATLFADPASISISNYTDVDLASLAEEDAGGGGEEGEEGDRRRGGVLRRRRERPRGARRLLQAGTGLRVDCRIELRPGELPQATRDFLAGSQVELTKNLRAGGLRGATVVGLEAEVVGEAPVDAGGGGDDEEEGGGLDLERVFLYSTIAALTLFLLCVCYLARGALFAPCARCCGGGQKKVHHLAVDEDAGVAKRRRLAALRRSSNFLAGAVGRPPSQEEKDVFRPVNKKHVPFQWEATQTAQEDSAEVLKGQAILLFQVIDENKRGTISLPELQQFLPEYGFTQSEVEDMFLEADANKDGLLDLEEWECGLFPKLKAREVAAADGDVDEKEARLLFDSFDDNKNGTLDSMELHRGLANAGLGEEEINDILNQAQMDSAQDKLTLEQFKRGILPHLRGNSEGPTKKATLSKDLLDKYDIDMRQLKYAPAPEIPVRGSPQLEPAPALSPRKPTDLPPLNLPVKHELPPPPPALEEDEGLAEREGVGRTESAEKQREEEAADRLAKLKEKNEAEPHASKDAADVFRFVVFQGGDESIAEIKLPQSATWSDFQKALTAKTKKSDLYGLRYLDPSDDKPKLVRNEEEWKLCMSCCMREKDRELEVDKVQPTTKVYKLDLKVDKAEKKRIYYQNLYDYPVTWSLAADNPLVSFKDSEVTVNQQEKGAIVLKFKAVSDKKTETILVSLKEATSEVVHSVRVQATWS